jgi:hypothetical protein
MRAGLVRLRRSRDSRVPVASDQPRKPDISFAVIHKRAERLPAQARRSELVNNCETDIRLSGFGASVRYLMDFSPITLVAAMPRFDLCDLLFKIRLCALWWNLFHQRAVPAISVRRSVPQQQPLSSLYPL